MFSNARGFTLIELTVSVAIIAVLAAFAITTYDDHARRARRTDALIALTQIAALQERHHRDNATYAATTTALGAAATSPAGHYAIAITPGANAATYEATATIIPTDAQSADATCTTFTLNANGTRGASDKSRGDTTAECWR